MNCSKCNRRDWNMARFSHLLRDQKCSSEQFLLIPTKWTLFLNRVWVKTAASNCTSKVFWVQWVTQKSEISKPKWKRMLWYWAYPNDKFSSRVISNPTADNSFSLIKGDTFEKCLFQDSATSNTRSALTKGKIYFFTAHLFLISKIILK